MPSRPRRCRPPWLIAAYITLASVLHAGDELMSHGVRARLQISHLFSVLQADDETSPGVFLAYDHFLVAELFDGMQA